MTLLEQSTKPDNGLRLTAKLNCGLKEDLLVDVTIFAAVIYSFLTFMAVVFQLALALGAPWGAYAMGGAFPGRFPPAMRLAAVIQTFLLGLMAAVVLSRAGLVLPQWSRATEWLTWVIVAFVSISVVLNTITPSAGERRVWVPVSLVQFASSLMVALTGVTR